MKSLLLLLAICSTLQIFASPTDTTRIFYDDKWKVTTQEDAAYYRKCWKAGSLWMVRDYFITGELQMNGAYSDDSMDVREGHIDYYHKNGRISKSADYVHDDAEGIMKTWHENGKPESQEFYRKGKPEGIARHWMDDGHLADSLHYAQGQLNGYQVWYHPNGIKSEEGTYVDDSAWEVKLYTPSGAIDPKGRPGEIMPAFPVKDGNGLSEYLIDNLRYPEGARKKGLEGKAKIEFTVTEKGAITKVQVLKSTGVAALDAEAMRVVSNMPPWEPASWHNRPVSVYFTLPITFQLE